MLTNSSKPRRLTRAETQKRILVKADELFRRYGFGKTTITDISDALGMSPANIYKFFESKNAIIQASADVNLGVLKELIREAARAENCAALERIEAVVWAIARFNQELLSKEVEIFKLMTLATEENWTCCREFDLFLTEVISGLLSEGIASRELAVGDPELLAKAVIDCLTLAMQPHLRWPSNFPESEQRARAQLQLVARGLRLANR